MMSASLMVLLLLVAMGCGATGLIAAVIGVLWYTQKNDRPQQR
jgi:hypothetical protein